MSICIVPCSPVVLDLLSVPEVCERGVSLDIVGLADALGLGAVQLGNSHLLVVLEIGAELLPGGGQFLEDEKREENNFPT